MTNKPVRVEEYKPFTLYGSKYDSPELKTARKEARKAYELYYTAMNSEYVKVDLYDLQMDYMNKVEEVFLMEREERRERYAAELEHRKVDSSVATDVDAFLGFHSWTYEEVAELRIGYGSSTHVEVLREWQVDELIDQLRAVQAKMKNRFKEWIDRNIRNLYSMRSEYDTRLKYIDGSHDNSHMRELAFRYTDLWFDVRTAITDHLNSSLRDAYIEKLPSNKVYDA